MPKQGPLLVVSNHPNTFMDPVVTASLLQQQVYFIAKSTVFGSGFQNWVLRQMHLIPIQRREDNPQQEVNNAEAFAASFKALQEDKTLLIFPEGNSFNQRRLRKIKTGAARIALGAEAEHNFSLGIKILPVGLNYSAPTRFRSDVFVNVGEPIEVADYAAAYQQDGSSAVQALTETMRQRLESLIIHTPTDEEDELARQIEAVYKEELSATIPATAPAYAHDFLLTREIIKSINYFSRVSPERVSSLKQKISAYQLELTRLRLHDAVVGKGSPAVFWQSIIGALLLALGLPVFLFGLLHNYVPYLIPSKVARAATDEEEWYAPVMLTVGMFAFPIFYALETWLVFEWLGLTGSSILAYLVALPFSGFFALGYWGMLQKTQAHWVLLRLFVKRKDTLAKLRLQRACIIQELEQAKQEYLQHAKHLHVSREQ
ncbi:1-acyl-sn-glycerol-3-phosphate acyltransferase [Pontibacter rugosus]|uniref:1-acyl-sn-glycerol-3-phosphate acyltransferase n=1 Tax=Pontibacter rugosus TaxID=1745966 RepID=A0ABW3SP81_9BACT